MADNPTGVLASLADWLDRAGLSRFDATFREHGIDLDVVRSLTDGDLKELGLTLGDRKRVLAAIATAADGTAPPAPAIEAVARPASEAERRQLTVLFADMVGSTALSQALDPEDLRDVMRGFHDEVAAAIQQAGGYVAKYMGDGVLAYFGWPQAQEDATERAVRAGLALVEARRSAAEVPASRAVRIGIATGPVVVGDVVGQDLAREVNVVGETPNLAARLLGIAAPNQVVISSATRRLVGGLFRLKSLGPRSLKGIAGPIDAYEVVEERLVASRFEAARAGTYSRFVGRGTEVDALLERWRQAKAGKGQLVLLSGEAGIGKSRIVDAFYERVAAEPHVRIRYQCSPQHLNTPLFPVVTQLRLAAGIEQGASVSAGVDSLLAGADEDSAVLFKNLLGLPLPDRSRFAGMDPERRRQLTLEALVVQLARLSSQQPVLIVLEDAHWIDPATQELASLTVRRGAALHLLVVLTHRPEYQPPWVGSPVASQLALGRLTSDEVRCLLGGLAGDKHLPDEVVQHLLARTDGIPLYVEEMFAALRESGLLVEEEAGFRLTGALRDAAVPASLQDSLMARLGRDETAKQIAQVGSVIGREFGRELLAATTGMDDASLRHGLDHLVRAGLVVEFGASSSATYGFKHALVQDAAYSSLLRSRRQQLHTAIVDHLESSGSALVEAQPELLAYHCGRASQVERAGAYWIAAGQRSLVRAAPLETVRTMRLAVAELTSLADDRPRWRLELGMLEILRLAITRSEGSNAEDLKTLSERMIVLSQRLGDTAMLINSLDGLASWHAWRAEFDRSLELANDLLALDHPRAQAVGSMQAGWLLGFMGEPARAVAHYDNVLEVGRDGEIADLEPVLMNALIFRAISLEILGQPARAADDARAALDMARQSGEAYLVGNILWLSSIFHVLRDDIASAYAVLEELTPLAIENGFGSWFLQSRASMAYVHCRRGEITNGLTLVRMGLPILEQRAQQGVAIYTLLAMWGAACLELAGEVDEALAVVARALEVGAHTKERWLFAELHRLRGNWMAAHRRGEAGEAESSCLKALDLARAQQANLFELRATAELARLRLEEGRNLEA